MTNFFVPIKINDEKNSNREMLLFSIKPFDTDMILFNGYEYSVLEQKIIEYFRTESIGFDIFYEKNDFRLNQFNDAISSIQLGVFCSAYSFLNHRQFKTNYDSITITGNFELSERGVELFEISLVEEKFEAVQKYASEHKDDHHLFIYVSPNEVVKEGLHENNLLVIRFDSNSKIEEVFAEIFEPEFTDEQKKCIEEFYLKNTNEYVQTRNFINWKKEIVREDCGGFIIEGESNTGKSIAAKALCEHLMATNTVDNFVWITANDNSSFLELIRTDNENYMNNEEQKSVLKKEFKKEFDLLEKNLSENKKMGLILDNIEYDFLDELLDFLLHNYRDDLKNLKIIITSWYKVKSKFKQAALNLFEKEITEVALTRLEFESIVLSVVAKSSYKEKFEKSVHNNDLIELIYSQIPNNPGFIPIVLATLKENSVEDAISKIQAESIKNLNPKTRILKIAFDVLNIFSQMVLLASFNFELKKDKISFSPKVLCKIITIKILHHKFKDKSILSNKDIEKALTELEDNAFVYRTAPNKFIIKKDIFYYCVFSKSENEEISLQLENLRNGLIDAYSKIRCSILLGAEAYDNFAIYIKEITEKNILEKIFEKVLERQCDNRFIEKVIDKISPSSNKLTSDEISKIIKKQYHYAINGNHNYSKNRIYNFLTYGIKDLNSICLISSKDLVNELISLENFYKRFFNLLLQKNKLSSEANKYLSDEFLMSNFDEKMLPKQISKLCELNGKRIFIFLEESEMLVDSEIFMSFMELFKFIYKKMSTKLWFEIFIDVEKVKNNKK